MSDEKLVKELEEMKAQKIELQNEIRKARAEQRETMIAAHRDRVTPAMLEHARAYGEFLGDDVAKFEAYLKALPQQIVTEPTGQAPAAKQPNASTGATAGEQQLAKSFGLPWNEIEKFASVQGVNSDGVFVMTDGTLKTKEQLLKN